MKREIQDFEKMIGKHKKVIAESEALLEKMRRALGEKQTEGPRVGPKKNPRPR